MPKVKPSFTTETAQTIQRNIMTLGAANGCRTSSDIAKKVRMPASTFCEKSQHPMKWRIDDLCMFAITFKTSIEWLVTPHEIGRDNSG